MAQKLQICWLGLGNMGRGMCKNLVEKANLSKPLIVYNRTQQRADELSTKVNGPVKVASTVEEAVKYSEIIFTCVGDDIAVVETISAALATSSVEGKLFVDCSTIHPDTTNAIAERIVAAGGRFVGMPVFGTPAMAENGQLVCVMAGSVANVEEVKPLITGIMGGAIIDLSGEKPSQATLLKLIGNTFIINMYNTLAEGLVLSEKSGLGTDNLHKFVEAVFPGAYVACSTQMRSGEYYKREDPLFAIDLARKDAGHAIKLAENSGCRLKGVEVGDEYFKGVQEHMGKRGDISSSYGAVRKEAGLSFENA